VCKGLKQSVGNRNLLLPNFIAELQVRGAEIMCISIWFVCLRFVLKLDFYVV